MFWRHLLRRAEPACTGKISIPELLQKLRSLDIRSVMVEGGASVIGSFLAERPLGGEGISDSIVDTVIVTVAPTFVGDDGVGYGVGLGGTEVRVCKQMKEHGK